MQGQGKKPGQEHEKAKILDQKLRSILEQVREEKVLTLDHRAQIRQAFEEVNWVLPPEYKTVIDSDKVDDEVYWSVLSTVGTDISLFASDIGAQIAEYERRRLDGTLGKWLLPGSRPERHKL